MVKLLKATKWFVAFDMGKELLWNAILDNITNESITLSLGGYRS